MTRTTTITIAAAALTLAGAAWGQETTAPEPQPQLQQPNESSAGAGWRRVADGAGDDQDRDDRARAGSYRDERGEPAAPPRVSGPPPAQLVLPAGSWIKVRVDQPLSSDRNLAGDAFPATLAQPLVVDGFVVARRGQTIEGRVTEARKAGRSKGTSALGIELTQLSLVDGRQMPVRTQLVEYAGGTSVGRDLAAAGTVTGTGAAIGAAAAGGVGAAIGAAAGAAASAIGVLSTRGRATEIYPEAELTFRTMEPITISTERSGQAFVPVRQDDYEPRTLQRRVTMRQPAPYPYFGGGYWGGYYDPFWGPWYRPYWGPSVYFYSSPRIYRGGGGFRGRR